MRHWLSGCYFVMHFVIKINHFELYNFLSLHQNLLIVHLLYLFPLNHNRNFAYLVSSPINFHHNNFHLDFYFFQFFCFSTCQRHYLTLILILIMEICFPLRGYLVQHTNFLEDHLYLSSTLKKNSFMKRLPVKFDS